MVESKLGHKIKFHEDEMITYEEDKINILANTRPRQTQYFGSMITITNFRIILSQKMVFGGYQIRYVIHMKDTGPDFSIKGGYISCTSKKENIQFIDEKKPFIQIETSGGNWVGILNVYLGKPQKVMKIIDTHF